MSRRSLSRAIVVTGLLCLLSVSTALAAKVVTGEACLVPAGEVVEGNLYVFGNTVTVEGRVTGDLVAAGSKVVVAPGGTVEGDILAAGQGVVIGGAVDGDVRGAAFTIQVEPGGTIGGELVGAAFSVGVASEAKVGDDVLAVGYQGLIDGAVAGDLTFAGTGLEIASGASVGGDVRAEVESGGDAPMPFSFSFIEVQPPRYIGAGLVIHDGATVRGQVTYSGPAEGRVLDEQVAERTAFTPQPTETAAATAAAAPAPPRNRAADWGLGLLKSYLALAVFGLLLVGLARGAMSAITGLLGERPLPSLGIGCGSALVGLALAVVLPILTILLMVFVDKVLLGPLAKAVFAAGTVTGVVATLGLYLLGWVGSVAVALWWGRALLGRLAPAAAPRWWVALLAGLIVVAVLFSLPMIGFLFKVGIACLGLGAVLAWLWQRVRPPRATLMDVPAGV